MVVIMTIKDNLEKDMTHEKGKGREPGREDGDKSEPLVLVE